MSRSKKTYHLINDFHLLAYESLDSTNEEAKRLAEGGAAHGAVIWAKQQTHGRGRLGREWVSEEGNLFVSLLLLPPCALAQAVQLSFLSAVAAIDALQPLIATGSGKLHAKWPNDILLNGKKLGGILLESFMTPPDVGHPTPRQWVIVGLGINIDSFPEKALYPATCLKDAGLELVSAKIVLTRFIESFIAQYDRWVTEGFSPIRREWLHYAYGIGQEMSVTCGPNEEVHGVFEGISDTGELLVKDPAGVRHTIHSGDVFFNAAKAVTTRKNTTPKKKK